MDRHLQSANSLESIRSTAQSLLRKYKNADNVKANSNAGLRVISINVRGLLKNTKKYINLVKNIKLLNPDIIFLQDTHYQGLGQNFKMARALMGGSCNYAFLDGTNFKDGILTVVKNKFTMDRSAQESHSVDTGGGWLKITVSIDKVDYDLINMYAPRIGDKRKDFMHTLPNSDNMIIMGGDCNVTLDSNDRHGYVNMYAEVKGASELVFKMVEMEIADTFRMHNDGKGYTWKSADGSKRGLLDRIFISEKMAGAVNDCNHIDLGVKELDHHAVVCDIKLVKAKRGKDRWFSNKQFFKDPKYVHELKTIVSEYTPKVCGPIDPNAYYDLMHQKCQIYTAKYAVENAQKMRHAEKCIMHKIQKLRKAPIRAEALITNEMKLLKLYKELEALNQYRQEGAQLRAQANRIQAGKPTKAMYAMARARSMNADV